MFAGIDGEPRQRVLDTAPPPLSLETVASDAEVEAARDAELGHVFDFGAPLLRVRLLRWTETASVLLVNCHHLIADGWSMRVLLDELADAYRTLRRGELLREGPAPIQYKDAAAWAAARQRGGEGQADLDYWRETLSGDLAALEMPTDFPRPALKSYRGAAVRIGVDAATTADIRAL